jgi:hypothetical protein
MSEQVSEIVDAGNLEVVVDVGLAQPWYRRFSRRCGNTPGSHGRDMGIRGRVRENE